MDINQSAFGLDMRAASRIYFMTPVLNPQLQAQAIGRVRRISQQKPVSVETLVLRGSLEEVIVERKSNMSQAEHWKVKSILDDRLIYDWIRNARVLPLPEREPSALDQTALLKHPQFLFRSGFGRERHPDEDILMDDGGANGKANASVAVRKRPHDGTEVTTNGGDSRAIVSDVTEPAPRRVRFA